jgi:hypothetical protein
MAASADAANARLLVMGLAAALIRWRASATV